MMGPRNDGRTGLTCPLSPSLTLSIALSPTDAEARAAFQSREKKERRKGNFTPLPLSPPSSSSSLDIDWKSLALSLSRRLHANTDAIWRKRRRRGRERKREGRKRKDGGPRKEGGAQINFLDPLRGGRAGDRPTERAPRLPNSPLPRASVGGQNQRWARRMEEGRKGREGGRGK